MLGKKAALQQTWNGIILTLNRMNMVPVKEKEDKPVCQTCNKTMLKRQIC